MQISNGVFGRAIYRCNRHAAGVAIFFFGSLTVLSLVTLIIFSFVVARPTFWALNFKNATCTVINVKQIGDEKCNCKKMSEDPECFSAFPCFAVHVTYNLTTEDGLVQSMRTMVHEDEVTGIDKNKCSTIPDCSHSVLYNNESVREFISKQGQTNQSYSCLYNPENLNNVIFQRFYTSKSATLALVIPIVFLAIGLIGSVNALISLVSKLKLAQQNKLHGALKEKATKYPTATGFTNLSPPSPFAKNTTGYVTPPSTPASLRGKQLHDTNASTTSYSYNEEVYAN